MRKWVIAITVMLIWGVGIYFDASLMGVLGALIAIAAGIAGSLVIMAEAEVQARKRAWKKRV